MKKTLLFIALIIGLSLNSQAQQDKSKRASPPDSLQFKTTSGATIKINYSRPSLKGRELQTLVPLNIVWRTGANEATTFETNKDVKINGQALKAGKYSLYTIPGETESTIIFNKTWKQWGTVYDKEQDALRVQVPTVTENPFTETFTISSDKKGAVKLAWGDVNLNFNVK